MRLAGVRDDQEVWTGSCPCQSFSVAGKKKGFADERHLWPEWFRLIAARQPGLVFGEQSASKDALTWLDLVCDDMEGADYTIRPIDFCAPSFGAPHIRQRLYFVADTHSARRDRWPSTDGEEARPSGIANIRSHDGLADARCLPEGRGTGCDQKKRSGPYSESARYGRDGGMADMQREGLERHGRHGDGSQEPGWIGARSYGSIAPEGSAHELGNPQGGGCGERGDAAFQRKGGYLDGSDGASGLMADTDGGNASAEWLQRGWQYGKQPEDGSALRRGIGRIGHNSSAELERPGPTNGHWRNADWLLCTDGKWRPVESRDEPMADGVADSLGYCSIGSRYSLSPLITKGQKRTMRLKGYGDCIVATQAQAFIEAYLETL